MNNEATDLAARIFAPRVRKLFEDCSSEFHAAGISGTEARAAAMKCLAVVIAIFVTDTCKKLFQNCAPDEIAPRSRDLGEAVITKLRETIEEEILR